MTELTGKVGFASPVSTKRITRCRIVGVELIATMALVVCLIIAATAVSIGMARAQALANFDRHDHTPFAVALFFGAVMAGMGGLTAMVAGDRQTPRD
jgi:prepilin signal peptidase PulO-like enzyme (type II secretory pathway)